MTSRRASKADIPQILPLWRNLMMMHAEMERMFLPVENAEEKFAVFLESLLDKENCLVMVAETDNKIAGYVIATVSTTADVFVLKRRLYVQDMSIDTVHRRQGIAKHLMNDVLAFAKEKQIEKIDLLVAVQNEGANKFWQEMGFRPALNYMNLYLA